MSFTASVWLAIGIAGLFLVGYLVIEVRDAGKRLDLVLDAARAGRLDGPLDPDTLWLDPHSTWLSDPTGGTR